MRKVISRIHVYGGLLCASYLIIFGYSSLQFNHHFPFQNWGERQVDWQASLSVQETPNDTLLAERVRDGLGLAGWIPWWRFQRAGDNSFTFEVGGPGKGYEISVNPERTHASVKETRRSFFQIYTGLHALGHYPNASSLVKIWPIYTQVCALFVVFAAVSGLYFWGCQLDKKRLEWALFVIIGLGGVLMMFYMRIWG
ncbi:MAG: hypothetical protein V1794_16405 [Candidatus Glassbacteria bacterium]